MPTLPTTSMLMIQAFAKQIDREQGGAITLCVSSQAVN
jgi:hypothetical protein